MSIVISQAGLGFILELATNDTSAAKEDLDLHLYKNDVNPTSTTALVDLTEATFTGYAPVLLSEGNWNTVLGSITERVYNAAVDFTSSADGQNEPIYGYYITRRTTGDLFLSERLADAPLTIVNLGDKVSVTPRILNTNSGG